MFAKLELVRTLEDIRESILTFNERGENRSNRRENLLKQTTYWVYDPKTQLFGPSKFVAFRNIDFPTYEAAIQGNSEGVRFNGTVTRKGIESVIGKEFKIDVSLIAELIEWGEAISYVGLFDGVDIHKWRFINL